MTHVGIQLAETNLISYLIRNPEQLYVLQETIFASRDAKLCFTAVRSLHEKGVGIDSRTLTIELHKVGLDIGQDFVQTLVDANVDASDYHYLLDTVKKVTLQHDLKREVLPQLVESISSKDMLSPASVAEFRDGITAFLDKYAEKEITVYGGKEATAHYEEIMLGRVNGDYFKSSGDSYLDQILTVGFSPGTQSVLFGSTGSGKTAFALSLFLKQIHKNIPTIYVSLEMPCDMLLDRLFSMKYKTPMNYLHPHLNVDKEIPEFVFEQVKQFKAEFSKHKFFRIIDEPSLSVDELELLIRNTKLAMGADYLNVIIDLTSMLSDFGAKEGGDNRADAIENCMNKLNTMAKKYNCHILNIVQSNRGQDNVRISEHADIVRLRPNLNHIKSSNAIAERARLVMSVFRPRYYAERYLPDDPETATMDDVMEIAVLKQSQGRLGLLQYLFEPEISSIYKLEQEPELEEN